MASPAVVSRPLAPRSSRCVAVQLRHCSDKRLSKLPRTFEYEPLFQPNANDNPIKFRKLDRLSQYVSKVQLPNGESLLKVEPEVFRELAYEAIVDIQHLFRPAHLKQVAKILDDPEASANDKVVAMELLKNAVVAAGKVMPSCQDTGTACVVGYKGHTVLTDGREDEYLSEGIHRAYTTGHLRYSQVAPLTMFSEKNTRNNLPAQIDLFTKQKDYYEMMFVAKGGGSANKTKLLQKTKATLTEAKFTEMVTEELVALGTAACPPYHFAMVVGGLSAEQNLKTLKLLSTKFYDGLPTSGSDNGRAFRDIEWEDRIRNIAGDLGIGAQFGGKYFLHDARVCRLPRHGASVPIGIGVSCSADRQAVARITHDGVFLEQLEENPENYLPEITDESLGEGKLIHVDLEKPMEQTLKLLNKCRVSTKCLLTGTIVVARDMAHATIQARLDAGEPMPDYMLKYPVYYAGPAKTPAGRPSGSFGPTTAGRMDSYVDSFQSRKGSMVMIGKGNRSREVTKACKKYGGFYLGSIGGVAATLSEASIKAVEVHDMEEYGMEAVWKVQVENFPAFIVIDNKGNDFFSKWTDKDFHMPIEMDSSFDETSCIFFGLDKDQSGTLSKAEVAGGLGISDEEAARIIATFDHEGTGSLDLPEFEELLSQNQILRNILAEGSHEDKDGEPKL